RDEGTGDTRGEALVNGDVAALAFAEDSNTVIAAMRDGTVHVIGPLRDGADIPVGPPRVFRRCGTESHFAGLSGDGTRLALTSAKDNACVFDVATGRRLLRLKSGRQAAGRIVWPSRDGTSVTVVGHDGRLRTWRFGSAPSPKRGEVDAKRLTPLFRARGPIQSLVVSPSGAEIAFTTLERGVTVLRSLAGSPVAGI